MTISVIITESIRKILNSKGLSQADLARKAGLPVSSLQNLYSNVTKDPKISMLLAITKALNVSIYDLIGYENTPAEAKEFFKHVILEVEAMANALKLQLTEEKKKMVVNEIYQFALQKAGGNSTTALSVDQTYLEMLLKSSN